jgi:hypothetical protein
MAEKDKKPKGLSRREFLKGMGSSMIGTAVLGSGGLMPKEAAAEILGPEAESISGRRVIQLKINGKLQSVEVEPRTTLLTSAGPARFWWKTKRFFPAWPLPSISGARRSPPWKD